MKKLLFTLAIASFTFGSFAQTQIGLKLGWVSSKATSMYVKKEAKTEEAAASFKNNVAPTTGYNVGLAMSFGEDIFTFQPEVLFAKRGYMLNDQPYTDSDNLGALIASDIAGKHENIKYTNTYVDLKLMFNFGAGDDDTWRVFAQIGPSLNFWLSRDADYVSWDNYDGDGNYLASNEFRASSEKQDGYTDIRLELGVVLGMGFKYKLGPGWILINPRYEWGVSPMTIVDTGSDGYARASRALSVNTGYLFEF